MRPRVLCSLLSIPLQSDRRQEKTTMYMWVCAQNFWFIPNIALGVKYTVKPQRVEDCLNFSKGIISGKRNARLYFKIYSTPTCAKENLRFIFERQTTDSDQLCAYLCVRVHQLCVWSQCYLLLLSVELEALSESAGLRLMMMFPVQIHTLSIGNVLLLSVSKQTVGNMRHSRPFIQQQSRVTIRTSVLRICPLMSKWNI